ncbi:uncharacterized protein G2W53_000827 [Senna tora]|uniref:Uncharacterized protein n=1 Tax=Senna tora TaxID=362788 RepID=A0A834XGM2_9FABA|nr:uncharacterized protein G2W53_000827 [Senna tora]
MDFSRLHQTSPLYVPEEDNLPCVDEARKPLPMSEASFDVLWYGDIELSKRLSKPAYCKRLAVFCGFKLQCHRVGIPPTLKFLSYFYKSQRRGEGASFLISRRYRTYFLSTMNYLAK